ncbi:DNRLRE domain-containing protein [Kitasatospora sp. NPDC086009]|uniref:DNRLRE domain-containing protein n=1 Tax=unclassified Kitasatospora TaxID=2633591 RepID=UPI0037CA2D03
MRRTAVLAALALLVETGVALDALTADSAYAAPATDPKATATAPVNEAPDAASALLAARLNGHRVEVTGARTATTTLWADPAGTLTQDTATGPVRVKVGDAWVPVDTTLVETPDGKVAPKVHPEGLTFTGGDPGVRTGDAVAPPAAPAGTGIPAAGTPAAEAPAHAADARAGRDEARPQLPTAPGPGSAFAKPADSAPAAATAAPNPAAEKPAERELVKIGAGEQQVQLGWLGRLPKPRLDGSRATYVDARPGVDLVLEATRTGFEQYLIVKDRSAVSQAGTVVLPIDTSGLDVDRKDDGSIELTERPSGKVQAKIPAPVMWDAAVDPQSLEHNRRAPVAMELRGAGAEAELVFTPDAGFLGDPATSYPVTIDPALTVGASFDTFVQQGWTTDQSSATELKLGNNGSGQVARSFLHFPEGPYHGKHILSAKLNLYNTHSWSCEPWSWEVWDTGLASTGSRWTNQPNWNKQWAVSNATKGNENAGCGDAWVAQDVTSLVTAWSDNGYANNALGLRASTETSPYSWKRFDSSQGGHPPFLSVTYNTVPAAPPAVDVFPARQGNPRFTSSATPTFQVLASDPDSAGKVGADFDLYRAGVLVKRVYKEVPNGSYAQVKPADFGLAKLDEGVQYSMGARLWDGTDNSPWAPQDVVVVADTTRPGAPFVTSADYPADEVWHGAAGQTGRFTLTPPAGTDDVVGYVYTLDGKAPVTVDATGATTASITPPTDGTHTLKVQTKDRADNLSDPAVHTFRVGRAGVSSPVDGSETAKRVKLAVDAQTQYTRVTWQYRRGPGATEYDIPAAHLTKADNTPTSGTRPRLAELGGHANWSVLESLGQIGGVVQVRALLYTDKDSDPAYPTAWSTFTADANADGATGVEVGPGSVNLLTGDYSVDVTDTDEFGMTTTRSSSSRGTTRGWQEQGERLTANQQQVSTDTTGFLATPGTALRVTDRGQGGSTDSLKVLPDANRSGDTYALLGGSGGLQLGMKPGHTYRVKAWVYVPSSTGLTAGLDDRGMRIVAVHGKVGALTTTVSRKAPYTDAWAELTTDVTLAADATEAQIRLYNGHSDNADKPVYFDGMSVRELVAPFGPQWAGGAHGESADYVSLAFPSADAAVLKGVDDTSLTFARAQDGTLFPEPGAEHLVLKATGDTYTLSELDGSATVFARQAGSDVYSVQSSSGPDAGSTARYVYDSTDRRSLVKRVIAPVEPGVDDANGCTVDPLPRGCEVTDYDYASATTATAAAPGDFTDRIRSVKVWSWNPVTAKQEAVEVAHYVYDERGRLAQVWDPRLAQPLKTAYDYDDAGRVTRITPAGELPWNLDYGRAAADQDPGRLLKVRRAALARGSRDQVSGETASKVVYDVPLTRAMGGPYDLGGPDVAAWAQTDAPTDATAVYGPEDDPGTGTATAARPGPDGYRPAVVHYLNASGNEVNTATPSTTPGGDIDTTEYDRYGHAVRTLEATNRAIALGTHPDTERLAAELNLPADSASRARLLDSRTLYTPDGLDVTETLGPVYRASLAEQVDGQTAPVTVTAEGESLVQLGATDPVRVQTLATCCAGAGWSGGGQVFLAADAVGDNASFRISVPEEGTYQLGALLTKAADYGIVQLSIDGQNVGAPFDGYSAAVTTTPFAAGPTGRLARGDHELRLTVTGKNPAAVAPSYQAGLDRVTLTKTTLNPTLAAGTPVVARDHNTNTYDEGKPDGKAYHLVTTSTDGARIDGYADDVELRVTRTGYDAPIGGTAGWTLKAATSVTTDALGAQLTATIRYDAAGRAVESRKPGSTGGDAGTVRSVFYTAGANPEDPACANRPEWAGSPCATLPGGAVTDADGTRMPTTLPVKRVTRYSPFGEPEETTETNAGKSRRTVVGYDGADRITSTEITSDEGVAMPKVTTEYDPATGDAVRTTADGKSLTRVMDQLGRLVSYTDADGGTTTTEFDAFGKPVKVADPTGSTTYTYDRAKEPRGLVTSVNDSTAGEFTASYGPDGQLVEQTYPGGIVRRDTFNAVGEATGRTYTRTSDNAVVWAQTSDVSTQGQVARDTSSTATRTYRYDRLGRLVKAQQSTTTTGCATRQYAFDAHSNRLSKTTLPSALDGTCGTTGATVENHGYDSADRLTDPGFGYDAFGRTVRTATGATNTYWANDKVAAQEKGDTRQQWAQDVAHRLTAFTTAKKQTDGSWANATSKLNHYGDDSDEVRWVVEDTTQGTVTRNVSGPDTDLVATTSRTGDVQLQLTDLFGSVVLTTDPALTKPVVLDFDEFGIPQDGQAAARYGWLGGKQRSAEAQDGDILMGARLYSPALGRFLQVDPEPGGNAGAYDYCTGDPVNCTDLDGHWGMPKWLKKTVHVVAKVAEVASYIPGPIGSAAAAVSAVSYAATGNWRKAAEMSITAAAGLVGGNTAVRAGFAAARYSRGAARVRRVSSRVRSVFRRTGCNSFDPGTPVLMGDGGQLPIGEVQVGDLVLSTDPATGQTRPEPVLSVIYGYGTKHLVDIETATADPSTATASASATGDPDTAAALRVTAEHPVWVSGKGWTDAAQVRVGDSLVTPAGTPVPVTRVTDRGEIADQLVVNLTIGDQHTYSVRVGDDWVVAHNKNACHIDLPHILGGHGAKSRVAGKSRFRSRNVREVKYLIHTTIKKGKSRANTGGRDGRIYEHDFGRIIGRDGNGRHTTRLRVVVKQHKGRRTARTAHPY